MAKEYLRDLVNRNLVTTVDSTCGGEIRTCRLHDLIGDFCRRQVEEDIFLWLRDGNAAFDSSSSTIPNLYRVSVQKSFDEVEPTILENIHSLIIWPVIKRINFWAEIGLTKYVLENLKLVQVLHLEGRTESIFLDHLVHLRYLSVAGWRGEVLESICNFWKLETLVLESRGSLKLPKTIWKMKMLRHLEVPLGCEFDLNDDDKEESQQLLDNLLVLSNLYLVDKSIARAVLQRLPNIQKFTCSLLGSEWMGEVFTIDFLHNLESLTLHSFIPDIQVSFPLALKRVYFCAWVSCTKDVLSAVGELPYLEVLKLGGQFMRWEVEDGQFQKLKCLELCLEDLKVWNAPFDSFYCLEQLSFSSCRSLEEIPACFAECPTLRKIKTIYCSKELVNSAFQILQEQKDNGNEIEHFYM